MSPMNPLLPNPLLPGFHFQPLEPTPAGNLLNSSSNTTHQMPAEFLTKWIPRAKLEHSLRYACNSHGALTGSLTNGPAL